MKNVFCKLIAFVGIIGISSALTSNVNAMEITKDKIINSEKVEISNIDYNLMKTKYKLTDDVIDLMPKQMIESVLSADPSEYAYEVKYIATTYVKDKKGNVINTFEKEVTKEESDLIATNNSKINALNVTGSYIYGYEYETASKTMVLQHYNAGSQTISTLLVNWKNTPSVKSYDVIGFRYGRNVNFESISAHQRYDGDRIYYSMDGTNMKRTSNGIGISMNLVDSASDFSLFFQVRITKQNSLVPVYASYQHATRNVSLANSKDYTFNSSGLGGVFKFNSNTIAGYYDNMTGLYYDRTHI